MKTPIMKTPILTLNKICLHTASKVAAILDAISLDIYPDDFIILLGSNGSGKSSLIKVINGLSSPSSGRIIFKGQDVTSCSISSRAQSIVTLTQDLGLSTFSDLTVLENCLIALQRNRRLAFSLSRKSEREKILHHLSLYNPKLCDKLEEKVSLLSGGERQTLAFAMSIWDNPSLLLLDEHTSALDPAMAAKLMSLTNQIAISKQITTVMTTHNLDDALQYGNRLIAMKHGKIILDSRGAAKEALTRSELLALY